MVSIDVAREWLRITGTENDGVISGLLGAVPDYIEVTTGLSPAEQGSEPLADTIAKFLLISWFDAESSDIERLQRAIDNLLKVLTAKVRGRGEKQ